MNTKTKMPLNIFIGLNLDNYFEIACTHLNPVCSKLVSGLLSFSAAHFNMKLYEISFDAPLGFFWFSCRHLHEVYEM